VVKDLKPSYTAIDADHALGALEAFEEKWGQQLPVVGQAWRDRWEYVIPFLAFQPEVRRVIYTTRSRRSTGSCARRSRPRATSPPTTPPGN
jgi:transposase-like protein